MTEHNLQPTCNQLATDTISRQDAIDALSYMCSEDENGITVSRANVNSMLRALPSAQPDIKQAAKLLSDFVESCPGGDSYLITPDGEELRTDWGYVTDGIQLIYGWAERRTDDKPTGGY